jgi:hypothetical protein
MNKKLAAPTIDFADSDYKSFQMLEDDKLIISMNSWQEKPLKIIFKDVIQFCYRLGFVPKDLYEILESTSFLREPLERRYKEIPINHPYKLFQLEDINDFPFIQVVAESVQVLKE